MNSPSTYGELIWQTEFLKIHGIINLNIKNVEPWTILLLKDSKQKCQYQRLRRVNEHSPVSTQANIHAQSLTTKAHAKEKFY